MTAIVHVSLGFLEGLKNSLQLWNRYFSALINIPSWLGKKLAVCKLFIPHRSCIWAVILIIRVREIMTYILDLWVIIPTLKKNTKLYRVYFIFKWNNQFSLSYGGHVWKIGHLQAMRIFVILHMNAKLMLILGTALQCNMQFNIKACQSQASFGVLQLDI